MKGAGHDRGPEECDRRDQYGRTIHVGQSRRSSRVCDMSALLPTAVELVRCSETTRCANSRSDGALFRQPSLAEALNEMF